VEGPDGPLYADFHALRHTYLTLGGRAGIDLRTLQELAGHSSPQLTARYSHRRLYDLAGAVEKLPRFLPDQQSVAAEALRATGTDGSGSPPVCTGFAQTVDTKGGSMIPGETGRVLDTTAATSPQPLAGVTVEAACDRVRLADGKEAPPGFEPGMADLQSAALPLGEGAFSPAILATPPRGVNRTCPGTPRDPGTGGAGTSRSSGPTGTRAPARPPRS